MFTKNQEGGINNKTAETIIGPSVKVEGNFVCEGSIIVEGEVRGNVETNSFFRAGEKSIITANVKAKNARISGKVKGNIVVTDYLELSETAEIFGDIQMAQLSIAKGALINGSCVMTEQNKKSIKKEQAQVVEENIDEEEEE